jgi:hypothetical protein
VLAADGQCAAVQLSRPLGRVALRSAITVDAWLTVTSSRTPSAPITMPASTSPGSENVGSLA